MCEVFEYLLLYALCCRYIIMLNSPSYSCYCCHSFFILSSLEMHVVMFCFYFSKLQLKRNKKKRGNIEFYFYNIQSHQKKKKQ